VTRPFAEGGRVTWHWGANEAYGRVREVYFERVSKRIKGTEVVRNADRDNPAYLIEQDDGDRVLKSHSELAPARDR